MAVEAQLSYLHSNNLDNHRKRFIIIWFYWTRYTELFNQRTAGSENLVKECWRRCYAGASKEADLISTV